MLGSHFDLAKEVEAIAARRERNLSRCEPDETTAGAYADFDKKVRDFVEMIAPSGPRDIRHDADSDESVVDRR